MMAGMMTGVNEYIPGEHVVIVNHINMLDSPESPLEIVSKDKVSPNGTPYIEELPSSPDKDDIAGDGDQNS